MNIDAITAQAREFISQNKLEDARELLLLNGYINHHEKAIQKAYLELIPERLPLNEKLSRDSLNLFSEDPAIRIKAASSINGVSRGNWTKELKYCLADPRTISLLLKTLEDNEKVLFYSINSLGMIGQRYDYNDYRIFDALVGLYKKDVADKLKIAIAQAIPQFTSEVGWRITMETLRCKPAKLARLTVGLAVARYGESMRTELKQLFIDPLVTSFKGEKDLDTKEVLIKAIAKVGGISCKDILEDLLVKVDSECTKVAGSEPRRQRRRSPRCAL